MEVIAKSRFIRMSARKVRLVAGLVRGMDATPALAQLRFWRKAAALPVYKCLESAVANAENNFKLDPEKLYVKQIMVDIGPTLKRWRARAFGRAAGIRKHSCHITVVLDERKSADSKKLAAAVVKAEAAEPKEKKPATSKAAAAKPKKTAQKKAAKPSKE